MPTLELTDISLHYQHHPALPSADPDRAPLLLLAGMASDSASWQPLIEPLRQQQSLLIPDNRCTGQTLPNPVVSTRDAMVGDILGLLDALGIERVNVLGHSMGGMLGWALACQAPQRVSYLISAAALPQVVQARIELFRSLQAMRTPSNEADWFALLYQFLFSPEFFEQPATFAAAIQASLCYPYKQNRESFTTQVAALESFLQPLPLQDIRCPITMMTGSHDVLMTPRMLTDFASQHPEVSVHIVEQAAHALHWEQPTAMARIIEQALSPRPMVL